MLPSVTLVLGGVGSGKSAHAEALAESASETRVYVATGQAFDDEMASKINLHKARRGAGWRTIEAPTDLPAALAQAAPGEVVLVDCLTMWLSNLLMADEDPDPACNTMLRAIQSLPCPVILVSNEVGLGGIAANKLARVFANVQGRLNQRVAAVADRVDLVAAGLQLTLKGAP